MNANEIRAMNWFTNNIRESQRDAKRWIRLMKMRFPSEWKWSTQEKFSSPTGYITEWAQRFGRGVEYIKGDFETCAKLVKIDGVQDAKRRFWDIHKTNQWTEESTQEQWNSVMKLVKKK